MTWLAKWTSNPQATEFTGLDWTQNGQISQKWWLVNLESQPCHPCQAGTGESQVLYKTSFNFPGRLDWQSACPLNSINYSVAEIGFWELPCQCSTPQPTDKQMTSASNRCELTKGCFRPWLSLWRPARTKKQPGYSTWTNRYRVLHMPRNLFIISIVAKCKCAPGYLNFKERTCLQPACLNQTMRTNSMEQACFLWLRADTCRIAIGRFVPAAAYSSQCSHLF